MKCQKCQEKATFHITEIIQGEPVEIHLCEYHAHEYLMNANTESPVLANAAAALAKQMSHHLAMNEATVKMNQNDVVVCPVCGAAYYEFRSIGRLGCANDYRHFSEQLLPLIQQMQGATEHVGRRPPYSGERSYALASKYGLRRQMAEAVAEENYELASKLRDKIKEIDSLESAKRNDQ